MATKTFCDRCGQEIWSPQSMTRLRITPYNNELSFFGLCYDCAKLLASFLEGKSTGA